ncbi:MAG: GC-type dockerin domain-anchored protein [Phycisphaerales bacterium JB058]
MNFACAGVLNAQQIFENEKLVPISVDEGDRFGNRVAFGSGKLFVAAIGRTVGSVPSGAVHVFDSQTLEPLFLLEPEDGPAGAFAASIAASDGLVVVGAYQDDVGARDTGSVYVFDADTGEQIRKITLPDAQPYDSFGYAVALDDGVLVAGAVGNDDLNESAGAAYLYDVHTGELLRRLDVQGLTEFEFFGSSVAIDDGKVAVGAPNSRQGAVETGSVRVFDVQTGQLLHDLRPVNAGTFARFGSSVAIRDGLIVISARGDDEAGQDAGAAYIFDIQTGDQLHKLMAPEIEPKTPFGGGVGFVAGGVLVSQYGTISSEDQDAGIVHVFDLVSGERKLQLRSSDREDLDLFGGSTASTNGLIVVAASYDDDNGEDSGAVYLYSFDCVSSADVNLDGKVTPADFGAWLKAFNSGGSGCDQNGNGICEPADFSAWVRSFNAGCP